MASQQPTLTLKLLIDNSAGKVVFAEADKEVVDFLFSLLSIPLGTVVKLLAAEGMPMVGCVGNLYRSVELIDDSCLQSGHVRTLLLNPTPPPAPLPKNTLSLTGGSSSSGGAPKFYRCTNIISQSLAFGSPFAPSAPLGVPLGVAFGSPSSNCGTTSCGTYSSCCGAICPLCRNKMSTEMRRVDSTNEVAAAASAAAASVGEDGFVKGVVTYTVTDDLTVTKLSSISSITMLAKCNVGDLGSLEEREVKMGVKEGLEILKASLQSKMVLTDVFIGDKKKRGTVPADVNSKREGGAAA